MVNYSMEFKQFENMIKFAENMYDEVKVKYTPSGINISAVDAANISIGTIVIPNTALEAYSISADECIRTLDVEYIKAFLSKMKTFGSNVVIEHNEQTVDIKCGNYEMFMTTPKPETIRREPRIPDVPFNTEFEVGTSMWNKATLSMKKYFRLIVSEDGATPYIEGEVTPKDKPNEEIKIKVDFTGICNIKESKELRSLYDSEYMNAVSKLLPKIAPNVVVNLAHIMPIRLTATSQKGEVYTYMQAPRIEDE